MKRTPAGRAPPFGKQGPPQELLLVVEDAAACGALERVLREEGYLVTCVAGVAPACEALAARPFALVLAELPAADAPGGPWRRVQALQDAARPVPVALLTRQWVDPQEVRAHGAAFALLEPFDTTSLLAHVAECAGAAPVPEALEGRVRAYFDALSRQDWAALGALCTPDVTYHLPGNDPVFSRTVEGRDAFVAFSEETFRAFPGVTFRVESTALLPFGVVARYAAVQRTGGGAPVALSPGAVLLRFEGEQVARIGVRLEVRGLLGAAREPSRVA